MTTRPNLACAGNIAYRLAYNSLLAGLDPASEPSRVLFSAEAGDVDAIAALTTAIAAQDPDAAAEAATGLLTRALVATKTTQTAVARG